MSRLVASNGIWGVGSFANEYVTWEYETCACGSQPCAPGSWKAAAELSEKQKRTEEAEQTDNRQADQELGSTASATAPQADRGSRRQADQENSMHVSQDSNGKGKRKGISV